MTFVLLTAFAAIITTLTFLLVYSKMYDWHKSKMGIIMNLSLVTSVTPALGSVVYYLISPFLGATIAGVGWITFSLLLVWRLRELIVYYNAQKDRSKVNSTDSSEFDS